ncbi:hypothetical protein AN7966.2 [Aspergillus nidulans FGSC A4]|uniref:pectinesterase n=1 Tax=Emericella nidulans (strain FGSC A4 / ATCC 38163 / CBS 112.46 / NRRL 194 / M139) TaxID=227321 RepID=Q5AUR4_EMENI|nr:hypothetical protein [Aspergillus nidulans FGSC A4]EAA59620.1 hypothetical protein AN7966.2 [Aspergillus nidulans FGSC A4]CBF73612.1 TPA: conserved hypothetical protein [Aspergillus nidulans FGSC A4]|eukprot:XP_681235.1 hypothetical protein AN7966.2 [Aspergillus nidulans FGSC A4]
MQENLVLSAYKTNRGFYGRQFIGYQDTVLAETAGCVTASGRSSNNNPSWTNDTVPAADNYLVRPWESFARAVFQQVYLSKIITPAGWERWSTSSPNTDNATFAEYANYGPGPVLEEGPRASFSEQLDARMEIQSILGHNFQREWWVDTDNLEKSDLVSSCSVAGDEITATSNDSICDSINNIVSDGTNDIINVIPNINYDFHRKYQHLY